MNTTTTTTYAYTIYLANLETGELWEQMLNARSASAALRGFMRRRRYYEDLHKGDRYKVAVYAGYIPMTEREDWMEHAPLQTA